MKGSLDNPGQPFNPTNQLSHMHLVGTTLTDLEDIGQVPQVEDVVELHCGRGENLKKDTNIKLGSQKVNLIKPGMRCVSAGLINWMLPT